MMKTNLWKILIGVGLLGICGIQYDCTVETTIGGLPTGKPLGDLRFTWMRIIPIKTFPKDHPFTEWFMSKAYPQ